MYYLLGVRPINVKKIMETKRTHKDLDIWKVSMELVIDIYKVALQLPDYERYGLSSQMRRAALSIPLNISEGAARQHVKEYIQFLYISSGSLSELETQLEIAFQLKYVKSIDDLNFKIIRIRQMMTKLMKSLQDSKRV
jgi:four helix bundle protein